MMLENETDVTGKGHILKNRGDTLNRFSFWAFCQLPIPPAAAHTTAITLFRAPSKVFKNDSFHFFAINYLSNVWRKTNRAPTRSRYVSLHNQSGCPLRR
ncbi:MAG: hypothetical protein ACFUZC_04330 [Chthoniobacteraceae bacterium]